MMQHKLNPFSRSFSSRIVVPRIIQPIIPSNISTCLSQSACASESNLQPTSHITSVKLCRSFATWRRTSSDAHSRRPTDESNNNSHNIKAKYSMHDTQDHHVDFIDANKQQETPMDHSHYLHVAKEAEEIPELAEAERDEDMEQRLNRLLSNSNNTEKEPADQSTDIVVKEPELKPMHSTAHGLPTSLEPAPSEFEWLWIESLKTAVLKPLGWTIVEGTGKTLGMNTYKCVITLDRPEQWKVGLSIVAYSDVYSQPLIKSTKALQLAEFFTSMHMQKAGPPGEVERENTSEAATPELVDSWQYSPMDGLDTYGLEYVMPYSEFPDDTATAKGFQYHLHLVINRHENIAYEITFRAPHIFWDQAWQTHGRTMIDNLYLNWDDASPLRFA